MILYESYLIDFLYSVGFPWSSKIIFVSGKSKSSEPLFSVFLDNTSVRDFKSWIFSDKYSDTFSQNNKSSHDLISHETNSSIS